MNFPALYIGIIIPTIEYSKITKDIYNTTGVLFINATKINLSDSNKLKELNRNKAILERILKENHNMVLLY